jgi:hypothetical protein
MTSYFDKKDMFLEPKVNQHGSHMVMTNVYKQPKKKYANIDTRFRDDYEYSNVCNYIVSLPERINEVKSITIKNIEIPKTYYNISRDLGNNTFCVLMSQLSNTVTIPDGQYTESTLVTTINNIFTGFGDPFTGIRFSITNKFANFQLTNGVTALLDFSTNDQSTSATDMMPFKCGWLLGFIYPVYVLSLTSPSLTGASFVDLNGPRYLYLVVDEYSGKGNQQSMTCLVRNSALSKNILARITMDNSNYAYGSILNASENNGLLLSNTRDYNGKIDIQRLNVQLVNEIGNIMNLNGQDFSFGAEMLYE